jgi:MFS family permease
MRLASRMSQNPVLNPLPPHPLRNSPKHKDSSQPANTPLPRDSEAPQRLEDTIPDNGLRAWLQCAGSFFLLLASFGLINSFGLSLRPLLYPHFPSSLSAYPLTVLGVFQTYYQRTLLPTSTPFQIAWIGSLQAALLISLRIIAGPFYDRGYLRSLLVVGGVLLVVGMLMTGLCSQYWQLLLAQGVMVGLGSGCLFLPSIAVLPQYFKKKRALATGIGSSGSAIGNYCPLH